LLPLSLLEYSLPLHDEGKVYADAVYADAAYADEERHQKKSQKEKTFSSISP